MGKHMCSSQRLTPLFSLLLLLVAAAAPQAEDEFLLPDQAFRISGKAVDAETALVSWDIADDYYMYRSKFKFRSEAVGIETGGPRTPDAEIKQDEFFGEVQIYRGRVDIEIPLKRGPGSGDILSLEATSIKLFP